MSEVPDLKIETKEGRIIPEAAPKKKRDKVACVCKETWREDKIQPEKREHYPTVTRRTQNQAEFYSEVWNESQQEANDWQVPYKW